MEQEEIRTIDIEDFKEDGDIVIYADNDCALINSLDTPVYYEGRIKLRCFLIVVCIEGRIQVNINGNEHLLKEGDLLLGLPNSIIESTMISPNYKVRIAGFSTRFLQRTFRMERETWDTAAYIYKNPVATISPCDNVTIPKMYGELIKAKVNDERHGYHKEVMHHLFSALFCELMGTLSKEIAQKENSGKPKEEIRQADHILHRFVMMLSEDDGKHRSVSYFANQLCYTPKHFSKVIKQASGKTPLEFINEAAIEHIKYRLKRSDKSIKEIAEEFNFPNQSFFGKYVKMHVGMSPASYRNSKE